MFTFQIVWYRKMISKSWHSCPLKSHALLSLVQRSEWFAFPIIWIVFSHAGQTHICTRNPFTHRMQIMKLSPGRTWQTENSPKPNCTNFSPTTRDLQASVKCATQIHKREARSQPAHATDLCTCCSARYGNKFEVISHKLPGSCHNCQVFRCDVQWPQMQI